MDETRYQRTRRVWRAVASALVLAAVLWTSPASGVTPERPTLRPGGTCGVFQETVVVDGSARGCTHGDDTDFPTPAPGPVASAAAASDDPATCVGSGTDGLRVQLVYARPSSKPDALADVRGDIERWARGIDEIFRASSAETGEPLVVRWVTTPGCDFDIASAVVSVQGASNDFGRTISDLEAAGFDDPSRHYLIYLDSDALCGVAESYNDSRPNPSSNYNNGNAPWAMFARVDRGCWGATVGAHELMHTLGAVLGSAPNATPNGHCTDEWDVMCYRDGAGVTTHVACSDSARAILFDCNHDDYFHTDPPPGSFLASNWNAADSGFLTPVVAPPPPTTSTSTTTSPSTSTSTTTSSTTTTTTGTGSGSGGTGSSDPAGDESETARFEPLTPSRVLDTRDGTGLGRRRALVGGESIRLPLAGRGGLPATGFSAVVLNVTMTDATRPGFVTVFPADTRRPGASNLNTSAPGELRANQVVVPVSDYGAVELYSSGGGHLIVDVMGYFVPVDTATAGRLRASAPSRILDTRIGIGRPGNRPVDASTPVDLRVLGAGGVPTSGVSAVVLNLTATRATGPGYVTVYPSGVSRPIASNLNTETVGQTVANHVIVPVGAYGSITLFASRSTHLVVDVTGWFTDATAPDARAGLFTPITPTRAFDSRPFGSTGSAGMQWTLPVVDLAELPADAANGVVVANLTVTQTVGSGYLTAFPSGASRPTASNLNWGAGGETVPNLATVSLVDGRATLYLHQPTHVIVDVAGYYLG